MAIFVLIHGAWHGGWCWQRVARHLRAVGHEVYTPTLTGLGERVHLASPLVGLETHILDISYVLQFEDLSNVILVGHSYGGTVINAVADRMPERVAHLVYVDAPLPHDGQSLLDALDSGTSEWVRSLLQPDGVWLAPPDIRAFGVAEADALWAQPRLTPHPYKTFEDPIHLSAGVSTIAKTFVSCIGDAPPAAVPPAEAKGMHYRELPTGHDAMITMPRELGDVLLETLA
jgi:pimeloyl-ACP methyl ester carboxylesterase